MKKTKQVPSFSSEEVRDFFEKIRDPKISLSNIVEMLTENSSLFNEKDSKGRTILHYAATLDDLDKVKYLCGERVVVEKLIEGVPFSSSFQNSKAKFVDLYVEDQKGRLPLDFALSRGNVDVANFFREQGLKNAVETKVKKDINNVLSTILEDDLSGPSGELSSVPKIISGENFGGKTVSRDGKS